MIRRSRAFERAWSRIEDGAAAASVEQGAAAEIGSEIALASALRDLAAATVAPDPEAAWSALAAILPVAAAPARRPLWRSRMAPSRRILAALVALGCAVAVGTASLQALPPSPLFRVRTTLERFTLALSSHDGEIHRRIAAARLGDLTAVLQGEDRGEAPALALAAANERLAAMAEGVDVSSLDALIGRIRALLDDLSPDLAARIREELAEVPPPAPAGPQASPPNSENAPGHDPNGPGNSENAPGHDPNGPGNSENAPGHS